MEVNKDEADRCLSIARKRYDSGDISGAIKFTKKSIALYSTPQAEALLANLNNSEASNSSTASEAGSSSTQAKATGAEAHPSAAGTSKRHHTTSASTSDGTSTPTKEYTEAQMKVVKRVRACKTVEYYEILELKKECTDEEIKKAYRKLALQLHPDKNPAPGADEAFKMISTAFTILSDPQKRAAFDANPGFDPTQRGGGGGGGGFSPDMFGGRGGGFQQTEISPEEIFNMFFGGGGGFGPGAFGGGGTPFGPGVTFTFGGPSGFQTFGGPGFAPQRRRQRQQQQPAGPQTPMQRLRSTLISLAPLLIFFFFSLITLIPDLFTTKPPNFSFVRTSSLSHERVTANLKVPYFVQPDEFHAHKIWEGVAATERRNPSSTTKQVKLFEHDVERSFLGMLRNQCQREADIRDTKIQEALGIFGIGADMKKVRELKSQKLESCELFNQYRSQGYGAGL